MNKEDFLKIAMGSFLQLADNSVYLSAENVTIPVLEEPLVGLADAHDPLFATFRNPKVIGDNWRSPDEWMPQAKTVAAFFFPFSEEIRKRHRNSKDVTDEAWNLGYAKNFSLVDAFLDQMVSVLHESGIRTCTPTRDKTFTIKSTPVKSGTKDDLHFSTPWSNRHVCYVAGLGTFGIHRHLITEKGCCGAIATIITDCQMKPTKRQYIGVYDYCTKCGACIKRCPVHAITMEHLRNLKECSEYGASIFKEHENGACGKCLVGIPCEHRNPKPNGK